MSLLELYSYFQKVLATSLVHQILLKLVLPIMAVLILFQYYFVNGLRGVVKG
jgi:hypothetical protein